jgi:nucleotide-binding universal stress UspA family protein
MILIAVDGSPAADRATDIGLELATAQGACVVFLHFSRIAEELFVRNPEHGPSQDEIEAADRVLHDAAAKARAREIPFELEIVDEHGAGNMAAVISGIAEGRSARLVVVGTRGRGPISGAVLGSVSHALLSYSRLPVVVVHAPTASD